MVKEKLDAVREKLMAEKEEKKKNFIKNLTERFNNLKPFQTDEDIPDIPIVEFKDVYNDVIVKNLIRCGAIPKNKLVIGKTYIGNCRNTNEATWNGEKFDYKRYKFGMWFDDTINHFQDDNGYDLFVPIREKD